MEQSNPLQFFVDLADEKPIEGLSRQLQREQYLSEFSIEDLIDEDGNIKAEQPRWADDLIGDSGYWYSSYFVDNLPRKMLTEQSKALNSIDNNLATVPDLNVAFTKLTTFIQSLDAVISKLQAIDQVKLYPSVMESVGTLRDELQKRKKRIIQPAQGAKDAEPSKIQWLGQVNVLGTLFYHLLKGQDGGAPYIAGSVEQVKRLLVDNFVDSEGHELSKGTLDTIFTPSRHEKRANEGDRIELPNKRVKK